MKPLLIAVLLPGMLLAQNQWDGSSNGNWDTGDNWSSGTQPNAVGAHATLGDIVTANTSVGLRGTRTVGRLEINGGQNFTIFNGSGGVRDLRLDTSAGNAAIHISGTNASSLASTVRVVLYDNLSLTHAGTGTFSVSSAITQSGGSYGVEHSGSGTTVFSGANSYGGATAVSGGTLVAANALALGTTGAGTSVTAGGTLAMQGGITIAGETLSLAGTGNAGAGALANLSGSNTFNGDISLGGASTIRAASGTLTVGTTRADRTLSNNGFTLTVDGPGNVLFNSQLSGSGGLIKRGTGTTTLFYGNNSDPVFSAYSGQTRVEAGLLITDLGDDDNVPLTPLTGAITVGADGQAATMRTQWYDNIGDTTQITVGSRGTFEVSNVYSNPDFIETVGGLSLTGGALVRTIDGASNPSTIGLGGGVTHDGLGASPANVQGRLSLGTADRTFDVAAGPSRLDVSATVSGTGGIEKTGGGTMRVSGTSANAYTGSTTVSGGTLELAKTAGLAAISGTQVTVNAGGTLQLGAANQINDASDLTLAGGVFSTGAGFSESLGMLTLSADSSISLGSFAHSLQFADSHSATWTLSQLTVFGWLGSPYSAGTNGRIFFGSGATGLTLSQLALVQFDGFAPGATLLSSGELVPLAVPAAPSAHAAAALSAFFAMGERKRIALCVNRLLARIRQAAASLRRLGVKALCQNR